MKKMVEKALLNFIEKKDTAAEDQNEDLDKLDRATDTTK